MQFHSRARVTVVTGQPKGCSRKLISVMTDCIAHCSVLFKWDDSACGWNREQGLSIDFQTVASSDWLNCEVLKSRVFHVF